MRSMNICARLALMPHRSNADLVAAKSLDGIEYVLRMPDHSDYFNRRILEVEAS